jgi:hypothetical protein
MRLISNFHDYYDGAMKYFANDDMHTYIRNREVISDFARPLDFSTDLMSSAWRWPTRLYKNIRIIGFCGKIYPVLKLEYTIPDEEFGDFHRKSVVEFCFTPEEAIAAEISWMERESVCQSSSVKNSEWKEMWNTLTNRKDYLELFQTHRTPCFAIDVIGYPSEYASNWTLIINPTLKDYKFQKIFDSYIAMQELEMFLGNVLVQDTQVKVPVGSDVVIAESKGFDKHSFRNMPTTKR